MHELPANWVLYSICGAVGGLISQLLQNNCIEYYRLAKGRIYLGTLGSIVISAVAGIIGDSNPINAFVWGAMGGGAIDKFLDMKKGQGISGDIICKHKEDEADDDEQTKDK